MAHFMVSDARSSAQDYCLHFALLAYNVLAWIIASFFDPEYESTTNVDNDAEVKKEKPVGVGKALLTHVLQCTKSAWNAGTTHAWQIITLNLK